MTRYMAMWLVVAGQLAAPGLAHAQDFRDSKTAPIKLVAETQPIPVGTPMTIRGTTIAADTTKPVRITVRWLRPLVPGRKATPPEPSELSARYRADGTFAVYFASEQEGRYRVVAVSPDGSGRDSTEFSATGMADETPSVADSLVESLNVAVKLVDAMERIVSQQPVSPAQREFTARLVPLRQALQKRQAAVDDLRAALAVYSRIVATSPATAGAFGRLNRTFVDFRRQSDELTPRMRNAIEVSKSANRVCDDLVKVEEGFKLLGLMFTLAQVPAKILIAVATDFATAAAGDKAPADCGDKCKLAFTQAIKQHLWIRPESFKAAERATLHYNYISNLPGLAADLSVYASHSLFDQYCERFEGPVEGKMKAQYFANGVKWWEYTVAIKGAMTLAYRKGADARNGVALKGHIVGTGTDFTVWENALRVLKAKVLAGATVVGRTGVPVGFPYTDVEGVMAVQAVPTAFFIPVEGNLVGQRLSLTLGSARTDFNPTYTQARGRTRSWGGWRSGWSGRRSKSISRTRTD